ncbi:phage portal protein [Herbiconiux sp.]|uniref:phage portal protein n=1 Tax=Herbiconiux sp. TaxID=1871186 RepID=UPI0025BA4E2A|nr:phage portal protein [Herbiconiux sp.]
MPTLEKINVPGLSDDENRTVNLLVEQLASHERRNKLRTAYYDGRRAVRGLGSVVPPQYTKIGLALGWAAKGVDGLARRCNLDGFVWPGGDLNALGLPELIDSNFLLAEIGQARTDSLLHGVSYLINTQGDVSDREPKSLIHAKSALDATGEWNNRRRSLDNLLSITSRDENRITGFVLYLDGVTLNVDHVGGKWSVDRSEHPWHVPAEPMVYRPRASRRMGHSRITRPVMSTQDAALRALVRLEEHMDIYAYPKLFLLGANDSIFKNPDGSMKESWQMILGRTFGIPDNLDGDQDNQRADVKQFSAESPAPHLAHLNALAKIMARETDLSDADFALTDMANPTSEGSYSEARENLISEAESATDDWSVSVRRSVTRGLAMQNGFAEIPKEWAGIAPKWRPPMYLSKSAAADAGAKQIGSVPWLAETEVGLELLGLDEQQIRRALADKQRAAGRAVIAALKPATDAVAS